MDQILKIVTYLDLIDYIVLSTNILLFIFAHPILKRLSSISLQENTLRMRTTIFRGLNVIILIVYSYDLYKPAGETFVVKILSILAIFYLANFINIVIQYFIFKHYGKAREIEGKTVYIETYQTRLLSILTTIFLTIVVIIATIQQIGADKMLQAGGVIGFIGVMLGLTQSSWAPDIISGLIILNSDMFEEGDIVETDCGILGRVYKTKLFHTEIINISNNHRIMIRNAHLRDKTIHNLSKFASAKGLRECLKFNIGYEAEEQKTREMFQQAYDNAVANEIPLETNTKPEFKILETGDHAVTWGVLFYIKKVDQILNIRRGFREQILISSKQNNIDLSTPFTHSQKP